MPRAPQFWFHDSLASRLLRPLESLTAAYTARRLTRAGHQAPVPVICCGNVTVGGAGKTTLAIDLLRRLTTLGARPHALTRGYGGRARDARRVQAADTAATVGDEPLLLARDAPSWVGADRWASARLAVAAGAGVLVMDDGLQNPSLKKDLSLLVVDGASGFGNGRLLPAGPLRERVASAAARCHAAVLIGDDARGAVALLPASLPVLRADLAQDLVIATLGGQPVLAFAGIAQPEKFFAPLAAAGADLRGTEAFPDHHPFSDRDLNRLAERARSLGARLVTTPKDAVRLPPAFRAGVTVIGVGLTWREPSALDAMLRAALSDGGAT